MNPTEFCVILLVGKFIYDFWVNSWIVNKINQIHLLSSAVLVDTSTRLSNIEQKLGIPPPEYSGNQ